ncbi:hypothetical protein LLG95_02165 [bacterium]|nr:hypothetical protein [bacterium]
MLNRLFFCALAGLLACGVCAAQEPTTSTRRAEGAAQRPASMLIGVVISVNPESIVLKNIQFGTTSTLSLAKNATVVSLKQIKLSDIKETATVTVRASRPNPRQPDILNVQAIYVQPKGTPPHGLMTGLLNVEGTTPTLKLGVKTYMVRLSPRSYVFEQLAGTIDEVMPGQIVRLETRTIDDKSVVTAIAIRANVEMPSRSGAEAGQPIVNRARMATGRPEGAGRGTRSGGGQRGGRRGGR